jgi:hypothetical protein
MREIEGDVCKSVFDVIGKMKDPRLSEMRKYMNDAFRSFICYEFLNCGLNDSNSNVEELRYTVIDKCYKLYQLYKEEDAMKCLRFQDATEEMKEKVKRRYLSISDHKDFKSKVIEFEYTYSTGGSTTLYKCPCCGELNMTRPTANAHYKSCLHRQLDSRVTVSIRRDMRLKKQMYNEDYKIVDDIDQIDELNVDENAYDNYVIEENAVNKTSEGFEVFIEEPSSDDGPDGPDVKRRRLM